MSRLSGVVVFGLFALLVQSLHAQDYTTGVLKPGDERGYRFTRPDGMSGSDISVLAYAEGGGDIDIKCKPLTETNPNMWPWVSALPAGVERLYIYGFDEQFQQNQESDGSIFCSVMNKAMPPRDTQFRIEVRWLPEIPSLKSEQQDALRGIFDRCCKDNHCPYWKNFRNNPGEADKFNKPFLDFCHMPEQICDSKGNLIQLDMDNWGLHCDFPAKYLARFPQMRVLRLGQGNYFKGDWQDTFVKLAELHFLELLFVSGTQKMTGHLGPTEYDHAPICLLAQNLKVLQLSNNSISGSIPDCVMAGGSGLAFIDLGLNELEGPIPDKFTDNSMLASLFLDNNQLSGSLPQSLGALQHLALVNISHNNIEGWIPVEVGNNPSLLQLWASNNNLSGPIPSSLALHTNLTTMDLSYNSIEKMPEEWYSLDDNMKKSRLSSLRLQHNQLSGEMPKGLTVVPVLTRLNLAGNKLSGDLPVSDTTNFKNMMFFNISDNNFNGSIPGAYGRMKLFDQQGVGIIDSSTGKRHLFQFVFDVSYNNLTGRIPDFLSQEAMNKTISWTTVDLDGNNFENQCASDWTYLTACSEAEKAAAAAAAEAQLAAEQAAKGSSGGLSAGAIAGIVIGSLVGFLLLVILGFVAYKKWGHKAPAITPSSKFQKFEDGATTGPAPHVVQVTAGPDPRLPGI